jgi:hypothetical protein
VASTAVGRVWIKWGKGGEFRQILKKKKMLFAFKGYTCRFKSEAFASFASIALRPWHHGLVLCFFFVLNAIFKNISVTSWWSVLTEDSFWHYTHNYNRWKYTATAWTLCKLDDGINKLAIMHIVTSQFKGGNEVRNK